MPDDNAWRPFAGAWGLVLGASSGFGAATARELGRRGMGIIGVHLDRKVTLPQAEAAAEDVRAAGSPAHFFNVNAADDEKRVEVCERARELGPAGVSVNAIRAGVTDTPAARKIPAAEYLFQEARRRNPGGRLTCPEDVAGAIAALSLPGARWISGNVIGVDGGEDVTA